MRIFLMAAVLLASGCAPPGYHYETGDFFTVTPNAKPNPAFYDQSAPAQPQLRSVAVQHPTVSEACGGNLGGYCADQYYRHFNACTEYASFAPAAFSESQTQPMDFTEESIVSAARSQTNWDDAIIIGLVKAAYSRKWSSAKAFSDDAFTGCMNGHLLGIESAR